MVNERMNFDEFQEQASNHLAALTEAHNGAWGLGSADQWSADQETGLLTWSFVNGVEATAPFQIVGTYNSEDGTFLWGWDHPSVVESLQSDAQAVRDYANANSIERLLDRKISCTEAEAWQFAALATWINDRQGAYRGPAGTNFVFMTFDEVTLEEKNRAL